MTGPGAPIDLPMLGRYRLLDELGAGGMGRVYLGIGPDNELVAVKQIRSELLGDAEFVERFRREVRNSRKVSGRHTVAVVEADPDATVPWLASEFRYGPTLEEAVRQVGPLPEESVLQLAAALASALVDIHGAGLVHRDIKPSNILLTDDGPKVIDFGIARPLLGDTTVTRTGHVIGALAYMSPEQAAGENAEPASDVYSLGTVLLFALTGELPFRAERAEIPDRLRRIVTDCRRNDPAARPTPAQLLATIGDLPTADPAWPPGVDHLIARQRAAVTRLLSDGRTTRVDPHPPGPPGAPPPPAPYGYQAVPHQPFPPPAPFPPVVVAPTGPKAPMPDGLKILAILAPIVLVGLVGLLAVAFWAVVIRGGDPDPGRITDAGGTPTRTYSSHPDEPDESETDEPEPEPSTSTFDPNSLNAAATDKTPFTLGALLPDKFIDAKNVHYRYVAGGTWTCGTYAASAVRRTLSSNGCRSMLVGNFLSQDNRLMVTVFVYPFAQDTTARAVSAFFASRFRDVGCWDPNSGPGATACNGNFRAARQWQLAAPVYRYVVLSQSMYVNRTTSTAVNPWLQSAVQAATTATGPMNYEGNQ